MEREIILTGVGGQSVQLAAQVLARAATLEDRQVMYLATYGGTMRGGNTESTLVIGDEPISAPPIVSRTWSAVAMHHQYWEPLRAKLRPHAVVVLNSTLFETEVDRDAFRVFDVPATQIARDLGNSLAASMVLVSAYARLTGLLQLDSMIEAMQASVPVYRKQHVELNEKALRAGFESVAPDVAPAWRSEAQTT